MSSALFDGFTAFITQAGALGLASFSFVEALKGTRGRLGEAGIKHVQDFLGKEGQQALESVYGEGADLLLKQAYRKSPEEAMRFLRQGLNLALWELPDQDARGLLARFMKDPDQGESALKEFRGAASAADQLSQAPSTRTETVKPTPPSEAARRAMSMLDAALEARINLSVTRAYQSRTAWFQIWAGVFALGVSMLLVAFNEVGLGKALVVGISAVPIAPIAKDLVGFLKAAKDAYAQK